MEIDNIDVALINIYVVFSNIYVDIDSVDVSHEKKIPDLQTGKVSLLNKLIVLLLMKKISLLSNADTL